MAFVVVGWRPRRHAGERIKLYGTANARCGEAAVPCLTALCFHLCGEHTTSVERCRCADDSAASRTNSP